MTPTYLKLTHTRPTKPGWYWYAIEGMFPAQPCYVFEVDGKLYYTLDALIEAEFTNGVYDGDGFELDIACAETLWSEQMQTHIFVFGT